MNFGNLFGGLAQQTFTGQNNSNLQNMLGSILGNQSNHALASAIMPMILNWIQQQGSPEHAFTQLQAMGISNTLSSPLEIVQRIFSEQKVQQVAQQANTSSEEVYNTLADALPKVVQQMNNSQGMDLQQISGLASSLFK